MAKKKSELKTELLKDDNGEPGELITSSDLAPILAEIEEIKAQLPGLKKNDREKFSQLHERYLYLLQERDRLMGKNYG